MSEWRAGFALWVVALAACSSSSTNTAAGGGGSGGSGNVNLRCEPTCSDLVAAGCNNGPTKSGCLLTCKALTSSASCDAEAAAYFDCTDQGQVTCDAAGQPVVESCAIEYVSSIDCAVSANPNPAIVAPCQKLCDAVVALGCVDTPTLSDCNSQCLWAGATGIGCSAEWEKYLACAGAVELKCVLLSAAAPGCGTELAAYGQCVNAAS